MNQCKEMFGTISSGDVVYRYAIKNAKGMEVAFIDLGATVQSIRVLDKNNHRVDVALAYDNALSYETEGTFFGAIVAPYANRVSDARFTIDGETYILDANDNGNTLHSGKNTLAKKIWKVKEYTENKIVFTYNARDLEQGFPGNIHYEVAYEVTDENELVISYYAVSDQKTLINMTNHTYFNLNGAQTGSVEDHELQIHASRYTPVKDGKAIPTGELAPVQGTPFDFTEVKTIGRDIREDFDQLSYGHGYDHNFVIDKTKEGVEKIATAYGPKRGIQMDVWTDCLGVQLYTGNFMEGQVGLDNYRFVNRGGFCLETQYFPNAANEENFVRPLVEANVPYETKTIYAFSCK